MRGRYRPTSDEHKYPQLLTPSDVLFFLVNHHFPDTLALSSDLYITFPGC